MVWVSWDLRDPGVNKPNIEIRVELRDLSLISDEGEGLVGQKGEESQEEKEN